MWYFVLMYLLLIPGTALFIRSKHRRGNAAALTVGIKAGCTLTVVLAALVTAVLAPASLRPYALPVAAGLILGLVGDVVICQPATGDFLSGMIFFALGHLCYIGAFLGMSGHRLWAVPVFIVIYLPFFAVLYRGTRLNPEVHNMLAPVAVYGVLIVAMLSLAATVAFSVPHGFVVLAGAVLFAISDSLLAYHTLKKGGGRGDLAAPQQGCTFGQAFARDKLDAFGLYCYYIGQSLLAVSICLLP